MVVLRSWLAYRWRRFDTKVLKYRFVCVSALCGRERVGYSQYCRGHTDAIFYGPKEQWPNPAEDTPRYFPTEEEKVAKWGAPA